MTTDATSIRRTTQGDCSRCKVRFVWPGLPLLRDAICPRCDARLQSITRRLRWPIAHEHPFQFVPRRAGGAR